MRHLNVQLQPERAPQLDTERVRRVVAALAEDHSVVAGFETSAGDDEGPYINFTFLAKDLPELWARIKADVLANPELGAALSRSTIVVCEGRRGWDDYLLLHHYDSSLDLEQPDEG